MNSLKISLALLVAAVLTALITGCAMTVTPQVVKANVSSFDQGGQNSGFLGWTNFDGIEIDAIITPHARDRYNALVMVYSNRFAPPLNLNEGICTSCIPNLILIQPGALAHFATMNRWRKEGK